MKHDLLCPECRTPLGPDDVECIGTLPGSGDFFAAFDILVTCPDVECGARFNSFVGVDQFTKLED